MISYLLSFGGSFYPLELSLPFCIQNEPQNEQLFINLNSILEEITTNNVPVNRWGVYRISIKEMLNENDNSLETVEQFIQTILNIGLKENPEKTIEFLSDCIELNMLENLIKWKNSPDPQENFNNSIELIDDDNGDENSFLDDSYENVFQWVETRIPPPKEPFQPEQQNVLLSECRKFISLIFNFIPNLLNIFSDACGVMDPQTSYTTFYDKYLVVSILISFFNIPKYLGKILVPYFKTTLQANLCGLLIIAALGALFAAYQRWMRPMPHNFVNCVNLNAEKNERVLDDPVGQAGELAQLTTYLLNGSSVVLVGQSGAGKSSLIEHFKKLQKEGGLPAKLEQYVFHDFDCSQLGSMYSSEHGKLIKLLKKQMAPFKEKTILVCDEFHQIVNHPAAFHAFKDHFMNGNDGQLLILVLTEEEYAVMDKTMFGIETFHRRIEFLKIKEPSDNEIELMLREIVKKEKLVPVHENAIETIVKLSQNEVFQPKLGRSAKAKDLLITAIGRCKINYYPECIPISDH